MLKKIALLSLIITFPLFGFTSIEDSNSLKSTEKVFKLVTEESSCIASTEECDLVFFDSLTKNSYSCEPLLPYYDFSTLPLEERPDMTEITVPVNGSTGMKIIPLNH